LASSLVFGLVALVACGGSTADPHAQDAHLGQSAELATLEIREDNIDLFTDCPPPGDIGQNWFPAPSDWRPPSAAPAEPGSQPDRNDSPPPQQPLATARELVDEAYRETHPGFRHCYHENLKFDPTQDGRVAVVLRVGASGSVDSVETWGACALAPEAITCMKDVAKHVKLHAPAGGYATVVVPGLFTEDRRRPQGANDTYAAAAYVAVEALRPQLHLCEVASKRQHAGLYARATMTIDVDPRGHASHVSIDLWRGSQPLLACAGEVLRAAVYPLPAGRYGRIIAPIAFNPKLERVSE
jgi:hypothetical protein